MTVLIIPIMIATFTSLIVVPREAAWMAMTWRIVAAFQLSLLGMPQYSFVFVLAALFELIAAIAPELVLSWRYAALRGIITGLALCPTGVMVAALGAATGGLFGGVLTKRLVTSKALTIAAYGLTGAIMAATGQPWLFVALPMFAGVWTLGWVVRLRRIGFHDSRIVLQRYGWRLPGLATACLRAPIVSPWNQVSRFPHVVQ